jgi:hypothetical protein
MSQAILQIDPDLPGINFRQEVTDALEAVASFHKGPVAPTYKRVGYIWLNDSADPIWTFNLYDGTDWILIGTANKTTNIFTPEPGRSSVEAISQTAHGLAVKNVIQRIAGGTPIYGKAKADAIANCAGVCGIVIESATADTFKYCGAGVVTGLSGLTDGALYYLSEATSGLLTVTKPAPPNLVVPILLATSTSTGILLMGGYRNPDWVQYGSGSPEGVVTAVPGCLYLRTDGSAGTILYVKETGSGNTGWAAYSAGGRTKLSAARTYYVRTDGNDSNDGSANDSSHAFLTIQKAVDVASALDLNGYDVTIQIANGTYASSGVTLKSFVGSGRIIIKGDTTTPANVTVNANSGGGTAFKADGIVGVYSLQGMKILSNNISVHASRNSLIAFNNLEFGTSSFIHMYAEDTGVIKAEGNYRVSGGAQSHWRAAGGQILIGSVLGSSIAVDFTSGSFSFSAVTGFAQDGGRIDLRGITISNAGSVTGTRYFCSTNGVIATLNGGANFIPGNAAGSVSNGGIYLATGS